VLADLAEQLLLCAQPAGRWIGKAPRHRQKRTLLT
jgi:hypothetical protein